MNLFQPPHEADWPVDELREHAGVDARLGQLHDVHHGGGNTTDDPNCAPRGRLWGISPAPISEDYPDSSANQIRRKRCRNHVLRAKREKGRDEQGREDRLLSDAPRSGSGPNPALPVRVGAWRRCCPSRRGASAVTGAWPGPRGQPGGLRAPGSGRGSPRRCPCPQNAGVARWGAADASLGAGVRGSRENAAACPSLPSTAPRPGAGS